jgi:hypothetical protein
MLHLHLQLLHMQMQWLLATNHTTTASMTQQPQLPAARPVNVRTKACL